MLFLVQSLCCCRYERPAVAIKLYKYLNHYVRTFRLPVSYTFVQAVAVQACQQVSLYVVVDPVAAMRSVPLLLRFAVNQPRVVEVVPSPRLRRSVVRQVVTVPVPIAAIRCVPLS